MAPIPVREEKGLSMFKYLTPVLALGLFACSGGGDTPPENSAALESASEAAETLGPSVGSAMPAFRLADGNGEMQTLADVAGDNGTVIYFNRSLDWCPFCQTQTMEVNAAADQFAALGYGVVTITYDSVDIIQDFAERRSIGITLLSDPESTLVDALDIRDPVYTDPDSMAYGVPYPITFIVNAESVITHKLWHEPGYGNQRGYRERISVGDVLSVLESD
jgi:peroxiredoxin